MHRITVFGGHGFIGTALRAELERRGGSVICQPRDSIAPPEGGFGTLIWCIGLTADFRTRPYDTATAHVGLLARVLAQRAHDRVVFLSSTRVYSGAASTAEDAALTVRPADPSDLYNATKLAGEALVLTAEATAGVVVRLSNIVGPGEAARATFLGSIACQAAEGRVDLENALSTAKDYLWIDDAARGLADIATKGQARVYNLARGVQITHREWANALARETGCAIDVRSGAIDLGFAPINTARIRAEFGFAPVDPLDRVANIVNRGMVLQAAEKGSAMDEEKTFEAARTSAIAAYGEDIAFKALSRDWVQQSMARRYVYNFDWLGRPIIQYPQDMVAVQELIWQVRPDVVVETGIAHGGSLILSASVLAMLDYADAAASGGVVDPAKPNRRVIGVDIDIRAHNRAAIEAHAMAPRITMIEGSSVAPETVQAVRDAVGQDKTVMVFLDSMHTHDHVMAELDAYAPMVSTGSYCVVFDTLVEDMPPTFFDDRPWDVGNNPMTAVNAWIPDHAEFQIDRTWDRKLMITVARGGFLRRV
jgi:cephalosporin hydroxylase/nucleoside-diphosphate-sugar epimerase